MPRPLIDLKSKSAEQSRQHCESEIKEKKKRAGGPFNEMKRKTKKNGQPVNEMKRKIKKNAGHPLNDLIRIMKREPEMIEYDYQSNTVDDDEDFSKYWSDYDTWGWDKRGLGSM